MSTATDPVGRPVRAERGPRGRIWLYAIAFGLLLVAGWLQAKGNFLSRQNLVQASIVLSIVATLVAIASVLVPGRRRRAAPSPAPRPQTATTGNGSGAATAAVPQPDSEAPPESNATAEPEAKPELDRVPDAEVRTDAESEAEPGTALDARREDPKGPAV